MLEIKNLHARVEDKDILKGINLNVKSGEVHAIMGPNGSGKSTLSAVIAGKEEYEITQGSIHLNNEDLEDLSPEERAHLGIFMSFQYPIEIPGVTVTNFIKTSINETRKANGLEELPAKDMLKKIREKAELTVRKRLEKFNAIKKHRPHMKVGVLGCMAERLKSKLLEEENWLFLMRQILA